MIEIYPSLLGDPGSSSQPTGGGTKKSVQNNEPLSERETRRKGVPYAMVATWRE